MTYTFIEGLVTSGYVFDAINFDDCWVKKDSEFIHLYQEGENKNEWNYVKMNHDFDVLVEETFSV